MPVLPYELCDVFTERPLTGNALAVFTDANDLDAVTMQALAREMNLSESAFVLRPTVSDADARLRIFTPTMELPFAGHPTLGSAFVLAGQTQDEKLVRLETARGIVAVRLTGLRSGAGFGWMTQPLPLRRAFAPVDELKRALGVRRVVLPVELYDNGPHYVLIAIESAQELAALQPDMTLLAAFGSQAFVVFARDGERWKVRVFAPGEGIPEDPGTGAAAGPLALHLARYGQSAFGEEIVIHQGIEIGRPSVLHARATGSGERIEAVEVGGSAVVVARGAFSAWTPRAPGEARA